jgi:aspartate racemase
VSGNPTLSAVLGLIGGLGVGAAVTYYEELAKAHKAAGQPMQLLMVHADLDRVAGHTRAGEKRELAEYLGGLIEILARGGATFAVIPAITPHICRAELKPRAALPLLDLLDLTAQEIRARGLRRVALFGTRYTVQTRMFGALEGIDVVMPSPEEIEAIHENYFHLVETGKGGDEVRNRFIRLADTLRERDGAEAIVLAGTDLALVFDETNAPFPAVDCTRIHLNAILANLLANRK